MFGAAALEAERMSIVEAGGMVGDSVCFSASAGEVPQAAELSIFWQVPIFIGMGISEILTSIPAMDFFYSEAPGPMKSACSALELLTVSLGQWLISATLIPLVNSGSKPWIPNDLNQGRLSSFFMMLAVLVLLKTAVFVVVAMRFGARGQSQKPGATEPGG